MHLVTCLQEVSIHEVSRDVAIQEHSVTPYLLLLSKRKKCGSQQ